MKDNRISQNIRTLRINAKLTQEKIADLLQISRQRYAAWEENRNEPSINFLLALAELHNTSIDKMISDKMISDKIISKENLKNGRLSFYEKRGRKKL